ncbi:hypothetical protein V1460_21235 [Streptomyces sp. SCSIO 30461]|uniref:hypothetical protein n=1 Tax=Streptomyces sp. SCSIO 30461 TaxID=3118085 RepID=UPI0030CE2151
MAALALPVVASQPAHAVPPGTCAYVVNGGDRTLSVIATATKTVVDTVAVGDAPFTVAVGVATPSRVMANPGMPNPGHGPRPGPRVV